MRCARVIAKVQCPYRRPHDSVNHKGRVRAALFGSTGAEKQLAADRVRTYAARGATNMKCRGYCFLPPAPKGGKAYASRRGAMGGAAIISGEGVYGSGRGLRRPEREVFSPPFRPPQAPARPESHMSLGQSGPTRPTHADQLG
jgi:hypothetical protein